MEPDFLVLLSRRFVFHDNFHRWIKRLKLLETEELQEKNLEDALHADGTNHRTAYLNFLTVIYFDSDKHLPTAIRLTEQVLKRDPRNFNALWNRASIFESSGQQGSEENERIRLALTASANNSQTMLMARIEIADIYNEFLGDEFKFRSFMMYKEIVSAFSGACSDGDFTLQFHNAVSRCKLKLTTTYQALLMSDFNPSCESQKKYLGKLITMLEKVIEEPVVDEKNDEDIAENKDIRAKAMTVLANAKFEYFKNSLKTNRIMYGDSEYHCLETDIEYYFKEAIHTIAPKKEAHIYYSYALYKEYCAQHCTKSVEDFLDTIDCYQKAFEINSGDHRILHRIGLVYFEMWAIEDSHDARLKKIRNREKMRMERSLCISTPLFFFKGNKVVMPPKREVLSRDKIPPPYKMVGFNREKNSYNFLTQDFSDRYLLKSQEYFSAANRMADNTVRFYLVSLARISASLGDNDRALTYLERAEKAEDSINMAGLLYEQWAMLIDMLVNDRAGVSTRFEITTARALRYYRESLRIKVMVRTSTAVTLHYMLRLLYDETQLDHQRRNVILQKEYFLIYMLIHNAKSAVNILPEFKNDEIKIWITWNLIEMLYKRNENDDAATAFAYLCILGEAEMLTDQPKKGNITKVDTQMGKDRLVFQVSRRAVNLCFLPSETVERTYYWLLELTGSDTEDSKSICVIAASFDEKSVGKRVRGILEHCGVPIARISIKDYAGSYTSDGRLPLEFYRILHRVRRVVIVLKGMQKQKQDHEDRDLGRDRDLDQDRERGREREDFIPCQEQDRKLDRERGLGQVRVRHLGQDRDQEPNREQRKYRGKQRDQIRKLFLKVVNVVLKDRRFVPERVCVASPHMFETSKRLLGIELPVWRMQQDNGGPEEHTAREVDFYSMMEALFFRQSRWKEIARNRKSLIYERIPNLLK